MGNTATFTFSQSQQIKFPTGSAVTKYQPKLDWDTLVRNGQTNNVRTRHFCITAMTEYEGKSADELRLEDYACNQKAQQPGIVQPGGIRFGCTPQNTILFGAPQSTGLFGTQLTGFGGKPAFKFGQGLTAFNQEPAANLIGANPFGTPTTPTTTSAASGFAGFGKLVHFFFINYILWSIKCDLMNF